MDVKKNELKVIYLSPDELTPYKNNVRLHSKKDIEAIKASISEFGFSDPIGIYGPENIIVEGHGRCQAAKELGMKKVPCIRLDHLTDEQRKAYTLVHNKVAELSTWDFGKLDEELFELKKFDFDMGDFGFETKFLSADENSGLLGENKNMYMQNTSKPQYMPTGKKVDMKSCFDTKKYDELIANIEKSCVSEEEKAFLRHAAGRHCVFDYRNIAEYYCAVATPEMQQLMEESALVIIDINDAIRNGYAKLTSTIRELAGYEQE